MEGHNQTADPPETYGGDLAGRIARFIEAIVEWAGRLMMVLVFAIVMLVATNVILRYLFAIGPVSLQELEWHLMVPVALIGSAYTLRHHGHVRVDIFYDGFGARTRAVVNLFSSIGLLVTSVLVVWLSLNFVNQAYVIDEGSPDPGGLPHRFILKSMIPLGFGLLALQAVAHIILYSKRALGR